MPKVIDLFAGPGGLGEGFSSIIDEKTGKRFFDISLSIEKDEYAHQTLLLRSFFRQFKPGNAPEEYYDFLRGKIDDVNELYDIFPDEYNSACKEAWCAELGESEEKLVDRKIKYALNGDSNWILIGGPPCQAYSMVGRSRVGGVDPRDNRVFLYKEYLRIIAEHQPAIFVMENVKGLLSAKIGRRRILPMMLNDLKNPNILFSESKSPKYRIHSFISDININNGKLIKITDLKKFIIKSEMYSIPQARHRIILLGIRENIKVKPDKLHQTDYVSIKSVIDDLPRLRSGITKMKDSKKNWRKAFELFHENGYLEELKKNCDKVVVNKIERVLEKISSPQHDRGGRFVVKRKSIKNPILSKWFEDERLGGVCNHQSKAHMIGDIERYFFAACYADIMDNSPKLSDYPKNLLPNHRNVESGDHNDRFKVQLANKPGRTITSHLNRDGHYYIHYDPSQCRSFTVREAARIQTFPDNYFFMGNRTQQYIQVGNAVPPILARKLAQIVGKLFW